jgi:hypothetical protein
VAVLSDDFKEDNPTIQWRGIKLLRNIVAHRYGQIDYDIVWDICLNDVPELLDFCKNGLRVFSCCGMVCSECKSYPNECTGCPEMSGRAYWLHFVDTDCCPIYHCCIIEKQYNHCGKCESMPCEKWHQFNDPTMSDEKRKQINGQRIELLT